MVGKRIALVLFLAGMAISAFAADLSAQLNVFSDVSLSSKDLVWRTIATTQASIDSTASKSVRASLSVSYTMMNHDGEKYGFAHSFALEKAYVRFRLPWFCDTNLRLTIGKSPVSWGYGVYFNAGDIIFGANPNDASGGLTGTYRTGTAWMVQAALPVYDTLSMELIVLPKIENNVGELDGRFGGRFLWNPGYEALDAMEAGYLWDIFDSTHQLYLSLDGTLWADYNLSVSTAINPADPGGTVKDRLLMSLGFFKLFSIPTDTRNIPLSIRIDNLYGPFASMYHGFLSLDLGVTDTVSLGVVGSYANKDNYVNGVLSVTYRPLPGLILSLQGSVVAFCQTDWIVSGSVNLNCQYSF